MNNVLSKRHKFANAYMKRFSISLNNRELQSKTPTRYPLTPFGMNCIKGKDKCG